MTDVYTKGQRVKVSYEGIVVGRRTELVSIRDERGDFHWYHTGPGSKVSITVLEPSDWPPLEGDIWRIGDTEFFVAASSYDTSVKIMPARNSGRFCHHDLTFFTIDSASGVDFKNSCPVLIRRRAENKIEQ